MWVDWQMLVTAASVLAAITSFITLIVKGHNFVLEIQALKNELTTTKNEMDERFKTLEKHHERDVQRINEENCLVCFALSACLDGLQQLGANHEVPGAKEKLDKYLNQQAHK